MTLRGIVDFLHSNGRKTATTKKKKKHPNRLILYGFRALATLEMKSEMWLLVLTRFESLFAKAFEMLHNVPICSSIPCECHSIYIEPRQPYQYVNCVCLYAKRWQGNLLCHKNSKSKLRLAQAFTNGAYGTNVVVSSTFFFSPHQHFGIVVVFHIKIKIEPSDHILWLPYTVLYNFCSSCEFALHTELILDYLQSTLNYCGHFGWW